ncbi:N-6 DNA methylase [Candidatus Parabeggiatoa sp. HSG14]|uniref:HsdM family class I SAM-dependent methyltransferase n=1 Tax=Candidatus Parabeggiatoa sp. HSG14 TaxID=3055593 RepID=UPI0025A8ABDE|nr:N-6 DNA methylase [Thiotrichales bacterium HSG14]
MHELVYANKTPMSYRKEFGQFFTPKNVARLMFKWIVSSNPKTILDPAFGLGIFFDVFQDTLKSNTYDTKYIGYEIDQNIISYLENNRPSNLKLHVRDYLEEKKKKYDAIICNPPYMRFQNFLKRHDVLPIIEKNLGIALNGYSNMASIFLIKSLKELNEGGKLAYIMPFEFFNTGYGKGVKKELLKNSLLKQIIFFENEKDIFSDATTTVCVLLCKNDSIKNTVKISRIESLKQLEGISHFEEYFQHQLQPEDLPYTKKWSPIISSLYQTIEIPTGLVKISEIGKFVRGIATGANKFFALTEEKAESLSINRNNLVKCITKSPQIKKAIFTDDDYMALLKSGSPVLCLNVKAHNDKNIKQYLKYGEAQGFSVRYLTKKRSPWYKLESRLPAPILAGVFNRGRLKVIRNFTDSINFTCFHSFYPGLFGQTYINRLFVYLISDIGQKIVMTNKRQYGGHLDKFEPGDLNACFCPSTEQFDMTSEKDAMHIIELAISDEEKAIQKANVLVQTMLNT